MMGGVAGAQHERAGYAVTVLNADHRVASDSACCGFFSSAQ